MCPAQLVRIRKTLHVTAAMAAGLTDRLWTLHEIAELVKAKETKRPLRGFRG
jgi:hypothetical protein